MSDNLPTQQGSDEVDLGQLFKLIGKAFDRFFRFIKNIFIGLFHLLIKFLLFIQKHFIKLAIAGVLGLIIGYFFDYKEATVYESQMIVEPNFNSTQQLYNNINYYNELAKANDSVGLSMALDIDVNEAASIKEVRVDAFSDDNQKIKLFDTFVTQLDTITRKTINFQEYLENFNTFDARFHQIVFTSTNPIVAKKVESNIVDEIVGNQYFKFQKEINDKNIDLQDNVYQKQLEEIDSLQKFYKELAIENAKKETAATSINLADKNGTDNKELALIKQVDEIREKQVALNLDRARKESVINIISSFPNQGVEIKGVLKSNKLFYLLLFTGVTFLGLLLLELNSFLKLYKEKHIN